MTNISEILKNAPKGLKLYSLVHGKVALESVDTPQDYYPIDIVDEQRNNEETLTKDGRLYSDYKDAECILFPSKEHKTWDNWQEVLFKVGDIVTNIKNIEQEQKTFIISSKSLNFIGTTNSKHELFLQGEPSSYRYATPEERNKFFKELNANGYKWNADTKQIEKIEQQYTPKYKVDDLIINNNGNICDVKKVNEIVTYKDNSIHYRLYNLNSRCVGDYQLKDIDSNFRLVTEEEKIKLISRGDIEKPFTINDFKPFDKVLIKYDADSKWTIELFEQYDKSQMDTGEYICLASSSNYCIPYNDETKHLLGTTDDCSEKYKTW